MTAPNAAAGPPAAAPAGGRARVRALDWHRTLVVFAMIECHALVFLAPEFDADPLRRLLNGLNGLIAPSFLFLAGMSLGYGVFAARDAAARRTRLRGALRRTGEVALTALAFRCVSTPALTEPAWKWWLQLDILACIAVSLLVLQPLLAGAAARPRGGPALLYAAATLVFVAAPFTEAARGFGLLGYWINPARGSMFPLLPWCGYAILGAALAGSLAADGGRTFLRSTALVALVAGAVAAAGPAVVAFYERAGAEGYWAVNIAERVWKTAAIAGVLRFIEEIPGIAAKVDASTFFARITLFGRSSLSAYVTHLLVLYGLFGIRPLNGFHARCDWPTTFALTGVVVAATYGVCFGLERRDQRCRAASAG